MDRGREGDGVVGLLRPPPAGGASFSDPVGARNNDIFIYIITICMYVFMYVTRSDRNKSESDRNKSGRIGTSRNRVGSRFASFRF